MALKERMNILIKDMKKQDARIEDDLQTYAGLLGNLEKHTNDLKKRKEEKEIFEQLLYRIGGKRDFFKDSVHMQTLENRVSEEEREIAHNNNLIEKQKDYYDALRKKDYQALWGQDEDKSAMAAICFAFEKWSDASVKLVNNLLEKREGLSEEITRYLLIKALVYSESRRETDAASEEADTVLSGLLGRTRFVQSDEVWQNIEACLRIRKTQRAMTRCNAVLKEYQEQKSRFEAFEQDYADNYKEILAEIKKLENQKAGREVEAAVKRAKGWFSEETAELEKLVKRRRNETAIIEEHIQTLQNIHAELENGMESGLQPEHCDAVCNTLRTMERERTKVVNAKELDRERKNLLDDYQTQLKMIKAASDAEAEKAEAKGRERVWAKANRKRRFREALPSFTKVFVRILIVVGIVFVIECVNHEKFDWGWCYFLPNIYTREECTIDSASPYYITLLPMDYLEILGDSKDLSFVINPFGTRVLRIGPAVKKIKIHNGTEEVQLNCAQLKKLTIPDSVTKLTLINLKDELALTLELPEHLEYLSIVSSPDLTDIGLEKLTIPDSVTNLTLTHLKDELALALELPEHMEELRIEESPDLTDVGFQALKIKEAEKVYIDCDKLKNINISGYREELEILYAEEINVDGDVQNLRVRETENINININGNVNYIGASGVENLTVNGNVNYIGGSKNITVNGNVNSIEASSAENITVNGNVHYVSSGAEHFTVNGKIDILKFYGAELNVAPRALYWDYQGVDELIVPEGVEILSLRLDKHPELEIPDGVKYLNIFWDSLTFSFNNEDIPEGILYYKFSCLQKRYSEYQAENCPEELLKFNFFSDDDVPDLSGY